MNVGRIIESRGSILFEDIFPMIHMPSMSSWESDPTHETPMDFGVESDDESSYSDEEDDNEASKRRRYKWQQSLLIIISLCTSWMVLPILF
jgi:hypothetical protein